MPVCIGIVFFGAFVLDWSRSFIATVTPLLVIAGMGPAILEYQARGRAGSSAADSSAHPVEIRIGGRIGYKVRAYVITGGIIEAVFAATGGRLPLFSRPGQAVTFATSTSGHDLAALPDWDRLRQRLLREEPLVSDDNRCDLDLPAANLAMDPSRWLPGGIIAAAGVAQELVVALDITEGDELIGAGRLLDRLDDLLREAGDAPRQRHIDQWAQLDGALLAESWHQLAELIDSRIDWRISADASGATADGAEEDPSRP